MHVQKNSACTRMFWECASRCSNHWLKASMTPDSCWSLKGSLKE